MADISKLKVPGSNTTYDLKDASAREALGKLGYSVVTVTFNSLPSGTIWKHLTTGGFYTSPTIDVSSTFDKIYSATLYDFGNLASNITVMPYIRPDVAKFGLWVTDPTDPQTLPMTASTMVKVVLFGILKDPT